MERRGEFCGEKYQRRVARTDSNEKIADGIGNGAAEK